MKNENRRSLTPAAGHGRPHTTTTQQRPSSNKRFHFWSAVKIEDGSDLNPSRD
jgi:hypothetical protein